MPLCGIHPLLGQEWVDIRSDSLWGKRKNTQKVKTMNAEEENPTRDASASVWGKAVLYIIVYILYTFLNFRVFWIFIDWNKIERNRILPIVLILNDRNKIEENLILSIEQVEEINTRHKKGGKNEERSLLTPKEHRRILTRVWIL